MSRILTIACVAALSTTALLGGCRTLYYETMETFGQHKRDLLVSRVEAARDDQEEAKEQFRSALDRFVEVVGTDGGGELREKYDKLSGELERSEEKAEDVRERIAAIEQVAGDLFSEWQDELDQYANPELRSRSEEQLVQTRNRYDQLIGVMKRAESRMEPVLVAFRDQVLFLKHNLNAQAVASLQGEAVSLESDISQLIADMEAAISEADAFIEAMGT
ncbi:MAG: DUF2959 domain-containing protein [Planctomycetota bacterium]|jgi:DNA-directed RNA polymerase alpha subunit